MTRDQTERKWKSEDASGYSSLSLKEDALFRKSRLEIIGSDFNNTHTALAQESSDSTDLPKSKSLSLLKPFFLYALQTRARPIIKHVRLTQFSTPVRTAS